MAFSFNGINQSQIAITGGVTLQKNTILSITGMEINAGTYTLGTVPAGKVWRITQIELQGYTGIAAQSGIIKLNDVAVWRLGLQGDTDNSKNQENAFRGSYYDAFVLAAGQTVKLTLSGTLPCVYNVAYVEETA